MRFLKIFCTGKICSILILPIFIIGCTTFNFSIYIQNNKLQDLTIEVLKPAQIDIPPEFKSVLFLEDKKINNLTQLIEYNKYNETKTGKILTHQPLSYFNQALVDIFDDTPKYKAISNKPIELNIYNDDQLNWDSLRLICELNKVDGLIALTEFNSTIAVYFNTDPLNFLFKPYYNYKSNATILFFDPYNKNVLDRAKLSLSKNWYVEEEFSIDFEEYRSNNYNLINGYIHELAYTYAKRISPVWMIEDRLYYSAANSDLSKAAKYAKNNNWEKAKEIWLTYASSPKINLANRAIFNLAIAYEMEGDLERSLEYAKKSQGQFQNYFGTDQVEIITERIADQERIKKQLGE